MTQFKATVKSAADITADREAVWKALTDPDLLAQFTPLLQSIRADGNLWTWTMIRFAALGVTICPSFTERMTFDEGRRIDYTHAPPDGVKERAGAEGSYVLADVPGGTHLEMAMTLRVELPLPRAATPAVQRVMRSTIDRTGQRFWTNLLTHLGAEEL
jgi:carbon monoxide dehydrogenase subunit G